MSSTHVPGNAGQYFSVLNCASLYGLSLPAPPRCHGRHPDQPQANRCERRDPAADVRAMGQAQPVSDTHRRAANGPGIADA